MHEPLYSDYQLRQMRDAAERKLDGCRHPLHPDYGRQDVRESARRALREVNRALADRAERRRK